MNINSIPVIGWAIDVVAKACLAAPFWFIWTSCGFGERYFSFLPAPWQSIPFWHCVGLFIVIGILRGFSPFVVNGGRAKATHKGGGKAKDAARKEPPPSP